MGWMGEWVGEINNVNHLSPVESEIRTELDSTIIEYLCKYRNILLATAHLELTQVSK